jgi:hypothetical protein
VPRAQEALRRDAARHDAALYAKLAERAKRARSRARDGLSDQLLEDVADLYNAAAAAGSRSPTRATWKALRTSRKKAAGAAYSTVARWVSLARDRGLLPPTDQGKARRIRPPSLPSSSATAPTSTVANLPRSPSASTAARKRGAAP